MCYYTSIQLVYALSNLPKYVKRPRKYDFVHVPYINVLDVNIENFVTCQFYLLYSCYIVVNYNYKKKWLN